jgi:hypothetical protein
MWPLDPEGADIASARLWAKGGPQRCEDTRGAGALAAEQDGLWVNRVVPLALACPLDSQMRTLRAYLC